VRFSGVNATAYLALRCVAISRLGAKNRGPRSCWEETLACGCGLGAVIPPRPGWVEKRGGLMYRRSLLLAVAMAAAVAVAVPTGLAAGSTVVTQFSFTVPPHLQCGILGTAVVHGTSVVRDMGDGTFFMSGTWFGVFTATASGKSGTLSFAGPVRPTSPPVIDAGAGTVTITSTAGGLFEKLSITGGPTLTRDAGPVALVDVFEYTGDANDPVGDFISETASGLHGPHPDLLDDSLFCDVLVPYLQGS
jgi:hypothetical protein